MSSNNLFTIDWERQDRSGLGGLSDIQKKKFEDSISRMNNDLTWVRQCKNAGYDIIPKEIHERSKLIAEKLYPDAYKFGRTNTEIATQIDEETYVLEREKARVYYENNIMAQVFAPVTSPMGKVKWDLKQYGIQKVQDCVKFSRSFSQPKNVQVKISNQRDTGIGLYIGYQLSKMQLLESEGELFDLEYELMLEASTQLARAVNEHIATGTTTIIGVPMDDDGAGTTNFKGFLNHGSNQSFTIGTTTTYGSWIKGFIDGLTDLKTTVRGGINDIICLMSGGCLSQMQANYPTYGKGDMSEWDEVKKRYFDSGIIKELWISDKLTGSTLTTSTQVCMLINRNARYMDRKLVLPLQTWSSLSKTYAEDINEVMIVGDIIRHKLRPNTSVNAFPVTSSGSLTTTDVGYLEEQRII